MSRNNFLLEEEEREFRSFDEDMRLLPWQEEQREHMLEKKISVIIRKKLHEGNPMAYKYVSSLQLNALVSGIAKEVYIEPTESDIVIMSYDLLLQALKEQRRLITVVGSIGRRNCFALIHGRTIGIHVPKTLRQVEIERVVEEALEVLDSFLLKNGVKPNEEVRLALKHYLLRQNHQKPILPIKIYAEKRKLKGEFDVQPLKNEQKVQMLFVKTDNVLHYHIM